ncbi:hypothetical protein F5Y04DRAFT_242936 [Hypomontagnella monticulosa]|nr:hypothetical protein F5Y04DRAFT_242936 [Hypomontagnella monticulosa]
MKPVAIITAIFSIAPGALGDFWINYVHKFRESLYTHHITSGAVFVNDPRLTCENAAHGLKIWEDAVDVSGEHPGLRVVPGDEVDPPLYRDNIWQIEFNTLDKLPGHYTLTKNRNFGMYDTEDLKSGDCHLDRSHTYNWSCHGENDHVVIRGSSMFFCESMLQM